MTKITSKALITKLRQLFATFGIPEQVVSDNGRQFTSTEFKNFCLSNGIQHLFSPPDKQSCNGQAERFVGSFKMAMNKAVGESGSALDKANRWLFQYRLTPHPATGMAPANLMFGRQIRSRLDLLPRTPRKVPREEQIQVQKYTATALKNANKATKPRQFNVDDFVYARMYNSGTVKWIEGRIDSFDGTKIALVVTDSGIIRRHVDQLKHRHGPSGDADSSPQIPMFIPQNNGGGGNNEVPDIPEGSDSLPGSVNGDVLNGGGAAENNTRELNPEAGNLSGYSARRSSLGRLLEGTSAGRIKRHVAPPVRLSYDKDGKQISTAANLHYLKIENEVSINPHSVDPFEKSVSLSNGQFVVNMRCNCCKKVLKCTNVEGCRKAKQNQAKEEEPRRLLSLSPLRGDCSTNSRDSGRRYSSGRTPRSSRDDSQCSERRRYNSPKRESRFRSRLGRLNKPDSAETSPKRYVIVPRTSVSLVHDAKIPVSAESAEQISDSKAAKSQIELLQQHLDALKTQLQDQEIKPARPRIVFEDRPGCSRQ